MERSGIGLKLRFRGTVQALGHVFSEGTGMREAYSISFRKTSVPDSLYQIMSNASLLLKWEGPRVAMRKGRLDIGTWRSLWEPVVVFSGTRV